MLLLDMSLPEPADNLALDEALLEHAEHQASADEVLRLWEFPSPAVVLGRGGRVLDEVCLENCEADAIPLLRRASGGGTVVGGPGCLMYSLILNRDQHPQLHSIQEATSYVLERIRTGLQCLNLEVTTAGISDLCFGNSRKFSGNSSRFRPHHILFHGTMLYDFPLGLVSRLLKMPSRQPDYRANRSHDDFIANLPVSGVTLRALLADIWGAHALMSEWPVEQTRQLSRDKYKSQAWNYRH